MGLEMINDHGGALSVDMEPLANSGHVVKKVRRCQTFAVSNRREIILFKVYLPGIVPQLTKCCLTIIAYDGSEFDCTVMITFLLTMQRCHCISGAK